jgi:hypothetical protein
MAYLSSLFSGAPTEAAAAAPLDAGSGAGSGGFNFGPQNVDGGGLGVGGNAPAAATTSLGAGVDTSALAGLGDSFGGSTGSSTGASAGERGLTSTISQYNGTPGVGSGAAPGAGPSAAASVSPFTGGPGMGMFSVTDAPQATTTTGTSSYNTGGAFGPQNPEGGGLGPGGNAPATGYTPLGSEAGTGGASAPGWGDAAKGFLKDYGSVIGPGVSGAGLVANLIKGNQPMPGENALKTQAAQLASQGQTLQSYLTNGTLPPGVATSLHSAGEAAKASIRSQYAARGMTGSDAEARDLANVDTSIVTQGASIASNLLQQGVQESGLSAKLYQTIMDAATQQDAQLGQAISGFAQSLVPRQNITISGAP